MSPYESTPGQTVGPFFHQALPYPGAGDLVPPGRPDARRLSGVVRDGSGAGIPDALVELRQADSAGRVPVSPGSIFRQGQPFTGWGRSATDAAGRYEFSTLEPAPVAGRGAAFFAVTVFARGLLDCLFTRAYLPDHAAVLAADPLLSTLDEQDRDTLVAVREGDGSLRFDIRLQGEGETVFLTFARHRTGSA